MSKLSQTSPQSQVPEQPLPPAMMKYLKAQEKQFQAAKTELQILQNGAAQLRQRRDDRLAQIDKEAGEREQQAFAQFESSKVAYKKELDLLLTDKATIIAETNKLRTDALVLRNEVTELEKQKTSLLVVISDANGTIQAQLIVWEDAKKEINDLASKIKLLQSDVTELEAQKAECIEDLAILKAELDKLHDQITQNDTELSTKKLEAERKLSIVYSKLKLALDQLKEAQDKDKSIREAWAVGLMEMEKRETVIKKRESKVNTAESDIQNKINFMKL